MLEETNLTAEFEEENLFDEPEEETETPESDPEQPAEEAQENPDGQTKPGAEMPATFKVKYMGQEMEMTADQLISNAQKGMDYDRIRQERDALKNAPELQILDSYAKASNMTREQFVQYLREQQVRQEISAQVERGVPEDIARQLYELRQKEAERAAREADAQRQAAQQQMYTQFVREYPEVKDFPEEVKAAIQAGETPLSAYRAYEVKQLKMQLTAKQQTEKNTAKAMGSVNGDAPPDDADAFLSGFDSVFN